MMFGNGRNLRNFTRQIQRIMRAQPFGECAGCLPDKPAGRQMVEELTHQRIVPMIGAASVISSLSGKYVCDI